MRNNHKTLAAFANDKRFNANGVPIVFYLKKIKTGLYGEKEVFLYFNHHKSIRGTIDTTDREKAKRMVIKEVRKAYPKLDINIQFWR
jgi:hypothetical protein